MTYKYKPSFYILEMLVAPAGGTSMIILGLYALTRPNAVEKNYWFASLIFFLIAAALLSLGGLGLLFHRPISIDEEGAKSYLFGRELKHISWSEVSGIERRRYTDPQRSIARYKYSIYGRGGRIWFDDQLRNLRDALDLINRFAHKNSIELIEIDSGIDTRKRIRETTADPVARKKLSRDGIRTAIQQL
jgi:hypothetical protein